MDSTSFEEKNSIEEELFFSSAWIEYIGAGPILEDNHRIVVVMYPPSKTTNNDGIQFFYATDEQYQELLLEGGSIYYSKWSIYGSRSVEWYGNQEGKPTNENVQDRVEGGLDANQYEDLLNAKLTGDDEFINLIDQEFGDDEDKKEVIYKIFDNVKTAKDFYERTLMIRELIDNEEFTGIKAFQMIFREIEGFFGISIEKKLKQTIIGGIGVGKLTPQNFVRYKYKVKQMYDLIEKDGIRGVGEVGRRFMSAKNPLVRNRVTYKFKEGGKDLSKLIKGERFYTGEKAVKQMTKFHRSTLRASKEGIIKRNAHELVKTEKGYVWRQGGKVAGRAGTAMSIGKKIPVIGKVFRVISIGLTLFGFAPKKNKKDENE